MDCNFAYTPLFGVVTEVTNLAGPCAYRVTRGNPSVGNPLKGRGPARANRCSGLQSRRPLHCGWQPAVGPCLQASPRLLSLQDLRRDTKGHSLWPAGAGSSLPVGLVRVPTPSVAWLVAHQCLPAGGLSCWFSCFCLLSRHKVAAPECT